MDEGVTLRSSCLNRRKRKSRWKKNKRRENGKMRRDGGMSTARGRQEWR